MVSKVHCKADFDINQYIGTPSSLLSCKMRLEGPTHDLDPVVGREVQETAVLAPPDGGGWVPL